MSHNNRTAMWGQEEVSHLCEEIKNTTHMTWKNLRDSFEIQIVLE